jgi:dTDP-4-amino-4,6-dideoxygalactose transaminase
MHLQPLFKGTPYYGSNISEDIFDRGICLPSDTKMVDEDIEKINEILTNFFL